MILFFCSDLSVQGWLGQSGMCHNSGLKLLHKQFFGLFLYPKSERLVYWWSNRVPDNIKANFINKNDNVFLPYYVSIISVTKSLVSSYIELYLYLDFSHGQRR